jgi:hypothetical protein
METITGRDSYLICQALAYAILAIERLPVRWQEASNQRGMKRILEQAAGDNPGYEFYIDRARRHLDQTG